MRLLNENWDIFAPESLAFELFSSSLQKFRILPVDLSIPGGELTPTLKMKRKVILEKYSDLVEDMYRE